MLYTSLFGVGLDDGIARSQRHLTQEHLDGLVGMPPYRAILHKLLYRCWAEVPVPLYLQPHWAFDAFKFI